MVVGAAALGLRLLLDLDLRRDKKHEAFIERWSKPQARIPEGVSICRDATAAIDISDGLAQDLLHLCNASGVGALVHTHKLPRLDQHAEVAREVGEDGLALALSGGEDYELLFTYPERAEPPIPCTNIGSIESGEELHLVDANGEKVNILRRGYEHFL